MDCCVASSFYQDYWEGLYNHVPTCEALLHEGSGVAKIVFRRQVTRLIELNTGSLQEEPAMILLTSLNRSLYNYCLYLLNLSLTRCCYENRVRARAVKTTDTLLQAGDAIIDAYAKVIDDNKVSRSLMEQACSYIQSHLEDDLSLVQVSTKLYVSRNHLCHMFKTLMGMTFCEYITQQRILRARALLLSTQQSIDEIAANCGFRSPTYFATVFKKEMGISPSAFRQKFSKCYEPAIIGVS